MSDDATVEDWELVLQQIKKRDVDAYPFDAKSFLTWTKSQYPKLSEREQKQIAAAIYRWFYGG